MELPTKVLGLFNLNWLNNQLKFSGVCTLLFLSVFGQSGREFIVKLEVRGQEPNCAGTIITENLVLTCAHCIHGEKPENVIVQHFRTMDDTDKYEVDKIVEHSGFDPPTMCNDISLVRTNIRFRSPWKPIVVNDIPIRTNLETYENCKMVGYFLGNRYHPLLDGENLETRHHGTLNAPFSVINNDVSTTSVQVSLISRDECSKQISNFGGILMGNEKLCGISNEDRAERLCSIGSGGPLLCSIANPTMPNRIPPVSNAGKLESEKARLLGRNDTLGRPVDLLAMFRHPEDRTKRRAEEDVGMYQMAIVSWGKSCSNLPGVYVRTDTYSDWIEETTKALSNGTGDLLTFSSVYGTISGSQSICTTQFSLVYLIITVIGAHF